MFYVYIIKSLKNNKSYVGMTGKEVSTRLDEHNIGTNQWTRNNKPFKLIYYESYHCTTDALHRERFLKSGVGRKLVKLIVNNY